MTGFLSTFRAWINIFSFSIIYCSVGDMIPVSVHVHARTELIELWNFLMDSCYCAAISYDNRLHFVHTRYIVRAFMTTTMSRVQCQSLMPLPFHTFAIDSLFFLWNSFRRFVFCLARLRRLAKRKANYGHIYSSVVYGIIWKFLCEPRMLVGHNETLFHGHPRNFSWHYSLLFAHVLCNAIIIDRRQSGWKWLFLFWVSVLFECECTTKQFKNNYICGARYTSGRTGAWRYATVGENQY